jgi:hypothetical protein
VTRSDNSWMFFFVGMVIIMAENLRRWIFPLHRSPRSNSFNSKTGQIFYTCELMPLWSVLEHAWILSHVVAVTHGPHFQVTVEHWAYKPFAFSPAAVRAQQGSTTDTEPLLCQTTMHSLPLFLKYQRCRIRRNHSVLLTTRLDIILPGGP